LNKYIDSAIIFTSVVTLGLATISIAEGQISEPDNGVVREIQLQKFNQSLTSSLNNSATLNLPTFEPEPEPEPKPAPEAISLIKEFEGFESQAYIDTDGTPVIGYGLSKIGGEPVQIGDRISPQQADTALNAHLQEIYEELDQVVRVDLSDRQLSALASIAFNVGINSIKQSTLVKKVNAKDYAGAANEFLRWDKANLRGRLVQLPGLTRRRHAERQLFLEQSS
jgi:GH24 family phage-related lysozyme (muramidase)